MKPRRKPKGNLAMLTSQVKLDNYSGFWCIEPTRFNQILDRVNRMDLTAHIAAQSPAEFEMASQKYDASEDGSIAFVTLSGAMTKAGSSLGGGSTVAARQAIRQAENDSRVKAIMLKIDSPGGTVSGTKDLADTVAKAQKPVIAFVEDLCCSAAMWVASQADEIYANNATATIGSIGTFLGLYDLSKALENEGIRAVVVKAGEFKAAGFPGTEITDAQIAEWQKMVDQLQAEFTSGIASGRKLSSDDAAKLATGQTWLASEAITLKLIDGIKTSDEVVSMLRSRFSPKGSTLMSESQSQPAATQEPATTAAASSDAAATGSAAAATSDTRADSAKPDLAAYKAAFGDVQGCVYFAEGTSYVDACTKHIGVLNGQVADLTSKLEEANATNAKLAKSVLGSDEPVKTGNESAKQGDQFATKTDAYASVISDKLDKLKT